MLIRNQYDGRLYEVPETAVSGYGEDPGYGGLGIPFLAPLAARAAARFLPKAIPFARRLVGRAFPGGVPALPGPPAVPGPRLSSRIAERVVALLREQGLQLTPAAGPQAPPVAADPAAAAPPVPPGAEPQPGVGEYPYYPARAYPAPPYPRAWPPQPYPMPGAPWPRAPRWVQPSAQYPGAGARRLYLRCASWWGQPGRVPGPRMPIQPEQTASAAPVATPAPPAASVYHPPRRRWRR